MANPARLLLDLFESWHQAREKTVPEFRVRSLHVDGQREANFVAHERAMAHLAQVRRYLAELEVLGSDTSRWTRHCVYWRAWILNYPHAWQGTIQPHDVNMTDDRLDLLHSLSVQMDRDFPPIPADFRDELLETIEEAWDLVREDDSLPDALRRHLAALLGEAAQCLRDYALTGDFSVRDATESLAVATTAATLATESEAVKDSLKKVGQHLLSPYLVGTAAGLSTNAITAAVTQFALPPAS